MIKMVAPPLLRQIQWLSWLATTRQETNFMKVTACIVITHFKPARKILLSLKNIPRVECVLWRLSMEVHFLRGKIWIAMIISILSIACMVDEATGKITEILDE